MSVVDIPQLTYGGSALDMNQVGLLRRSDDTLHDRDENYTDAWAKTAICIYRVCLTVIRY